MCPVSNAPAAGDEARAERQFDEAALHALAQNIKTWGRELGFGAIGISDTDLSAAEKRPLAALAGSEEIAAARWIIWRQHGMPNARHGRRACGRRRDVRCTLASPIVPRRMLTERKARA